MRLLDPTTGRSGTVEHKNPRDGTVLRSVKLAIDRPGEEGVPVRENVLFGVWNWINRKRQVRSARDRILSGS